MPTHTRIHTYIYIYIYAYVFIWVLVYLFTSICKYIHSQDGVEKSVAGSFPLAQGLLDKVRALKLPAELQGMLGRCLSASIKHFCLTLHVGAIAPLAKPTLPEEPSEEQVMCFFDALVVKASLSEKQKSFAKIFAVASDRLWPSSEFLEVLRDMCKVLPTSTFPLSVAPFLQVEASSDTGEVTSSCELLQVCELFASMSQVVATIAYLRCRFLGEGAEPVTRDFILKSEVHNAVGDARSLTSAVIEKLDKQSYGDLSKWDLAPWLLPPRHCRAWLSRVQAGLPAMLRLILLQHMEDRVSS